jgi:hypothetical protein
MPAKSTLQKIITRLIFVVLGLLAVTAAAKYRIESVRQQAEWDAWEAGAWQRSVDAAEVEYKFNMWLREQAPEYYAELAAKEKAELEAKRRCGCCK